MVLKMKKNLLVCCLVALCLIAASAFAVPTVRADTSITGKYNSASDAIIFDGADNNGAAEFYGKENYMWGASTSALSEDVPYAGAGKSYQFKTYYNSYLGIKLPTPVDITGKDAVSLYIKFDGISLETLNANYKAVHNTAYEPQFSLMKSSDLNGLDTVNKKFNAYSDSRLAFQFDTSDNFANNIKWENLTGGWKRVIFPIGNTADGRTDKNSDEATPDRKFAQYALPDLTALDFIGVSLMKESANVDDPCSVFISEVKAISWDEELGDKTVKVFDVGEQVTDTVIFNGKDVNADATKWKRTDFGNPCNGSRLNTLRPNGFTEGKSFSFNVTDRAYVGIKLPQKIDISNKSAISFYMYIEGISAEAMTGYNSMETQFSLMSYKDFANSGQWYSDNRITMGLNNSQAGGKTYGDFLGGWKKITFPFNNVASANANGGGYGELVDTARRYPSASLEEIDFLGFAFMTNANASMNAHNFRVYIYNVTATEWDYTTNGEKNTPSAVKIDDVAPATADTSKVLYDGNANNGSAWVRAFDNLTSYGPSSVVPDQSAAGNKSMRFTVKGTQIMGITTAAPMDISGIANNGTLAISYQLFINDIETLKANFGTSSETQFMLTSGGNSELFDNDNRIAMKLDFNKLQNGWNKIAFKAYHNGRLTGDRFYNEQANYNFNYSAVNFIGLNLRTEGDLAADMKNVSIRLTDVKAELASNYNELAAQDVVYKNTPPKTFAVAFKNGETVVETVPVSEGGELLLEDFPSLPAKIGYTGVWSKNRDITDIFENLEVTASYTANKYKVTVTGGSGNGSFDCDSIVTVTADSGKTVKTVTSDNSEVAITDNKDGTYSFKMPAGNLNITIEYASVKPIKNCTSVILTGSGGIFGGGLAVLAFLFAISLLTMRRKAKAE